MVGRDNIIVPQSSLFRTFRTSTHRLNLVFPSCIVKAFAYSVKSRAIIGIGRTISAPIVNFSSSFCSGTYRGGSFVSGSGIGSNNFSRSNIFSGSDIFSGSNNSSRSSASSGSITASSSSGGGNNSSRLSATRGCTLLSNDRKHC